MLRLSPCTLLLLSAMVVLSSTAEQSLAAKRRGLGDHILIALRMLNQLEAETIVHDYHNTVLECRAHGKPVPTFHWLKDGIRISPETSAEGITEPASLHGTTRMEVAEVNTRLHLDCLTKADEGRYECVADNGHTQSSTFTDLRVVEICNRKPAKIAIWTAFRNELVGATVRLICRATGQPEPDITWHLGDTILPGGSDQYTIESNGDLIISNIQKTGHSIHTTYRCEARNDYGSDSVECRVRPSADSET